MKGMVSNKYFRYSALGVERQCISESLSVSHMEGLKRHLRNNKSFMTNNILIHLKEKNKQPVFHKKSPSGWYESSIWKFTYSFAEENTLAKKEMLIRDKKYFHSVANYSYKLGDNCISENLPGYLSQHINYENKSLLRLRSGTMVNH